MEMLLYDEAELKRDIFYISKKLDISEDDLMLYMSSPIKSYKEWNNSDWIINGMKMFQNIIRKLTGKKFDPYY